MAVSEQKILEEQQAILNEVREIKSEVKGRSLLGKLFIGALAGAAAGGAWTHRRSLAGLSKRVVTRG